MFCLEIIQKVAIFAQNFSSYDVDCEFDNNK